MSKTAELNINLSVMRFAREEAGYSVPDIVKGLDVEEWRYLKWENTGASIPFFSFLRQ